MDGTWKSDIHAGLRFRLHGLQYDREAPKYRKKLHVLHPQCKSRDSCYRLKMKTKVNDQKYLKIILSSIWFKISRIFLSTKTKVQISPLPQCKSHDITRYSLNSNLTFPVGFLIPTTFSNYNLNCSTVTDLTNLQKVIKDLCFKIVLTFYCIFFLPLILVH